MTDLVTFARVARDALACYDGLDVGAEDAECLALIYRGAALPARAALRLVGLGLAKRRKASGGDDRRREVVLTAAGLRALAGSLARSAELDAPVVRLHPLIAAQPRAAVALVRVDLADRRSAVILSDVEAPGTILVAVVDAAGAQVGPTWEARASEIAEAATAASR